MEKIQIQFKESDYKVYHDYCLKYYQIHDAVRKQSIHAFLDLFEKGIIVVEAQDIGQARLLLSRKCDDLKQAHSGSSREGDSTILLQSRICSDLLTFCTDIEKIFRLIKKQGITANYLMILGTFSRVIEENRNSHNVSKFNLKTDVIEALANPLSEIIRLRLGTNRQWQSVLRELALVATRYNQRSSGSKFDLDIVQLIAPAVVSRFNKDVETREILSVLPSYFDESELDGFEAFLNQTPDLFEDENADVNWDSLEEPLNIVARAVATQRDQFSLGDTGISDSTLLLSQHTISFSDGAQSPGDSLSPASSGSNKKFAILVSPDLKTQVEPVTASYTETKSPVPSVKVRMQPFIPVIIGIAVIVLFIIGTLIISGNWNILGGGNTTNSTTTALKNITNSSVKTPTVKATTAVKTNVTTAKTTVMPNVNVTPAKVVVTPTLQSYSSVDIGNHLIEIAFGPDSNVIKKPSKDLITIGLVGMYTDDDQEMLQKFIDQFNAYSTTTKIAVNIQLEGKGDIPLNFVPGDQMSQIQPDKVISLSKDPNTDVYYFLRTGELTGEKTYINSDLKGNERNRWIIRAILYNMGFLGETAKYQDSIFYAGSNNASQLSTIDMKAIQLMFGKKVTNGMTRAILKTLI